MPVNVVGLSEIEPDAVIAYASVHIEGFKDLEFEFPSDDKMRELLMSRNIGWDFIKQKSSIPRMKKEKLKLLYKATVLTNNLGDISAIDYDNMFDFDLFNLSFPCTDLSGAGKQKGLKNEDGTHTRSGLIKFGLDIVRAKKPKYIMIENVKALIQKKFIDDFYDIVNEIESIGYRCYYPTKTDKKKGQVPCCLNAKDFGIAHANH
ncbi:MAG: DNA cytosine methyltransferase [Sarcina sp.]